MPDPEARAFTVRGLAEHWQVSTTHVYNLIATGKLGHLRIGSAIRVRPEDVEAFEKTSWQGPGTNAPTSASSGAAEATVTPSSSGGKGERTAFRRAQRMSARPGAR
jgi:excisionase family DNA binding protein